MIWFLLLTVFAAESPSLRPRVVFSPEPSEAMDERAAMRRGEAIEKLEQLLPRFHSDEQRAEAEFRLAELVWAQGKFRNLQAMRDWDRALGGGATAAVRLEDQPSYARSLELKRDALNRYRRIIVTYPNYTRIDEVHFNLASATYALGDEKQGIALLRRLVRNDTKSTFAAEAWLLLGEHFFDENRLREAREAYSQAVKNKKPRVYPYALYKLAWCAFNAGDYDKSLEHFHDVVAYSKRLREEAMIVDTVSVNERLNLTSEALLDSIKAYVRKRALNEVFTYYAGEVGYEKALSYFELLAAEYVSIGDARRGARVYRRILRDYPWHERAPLIHAELIEALAAGGTADALSAEVASFSERYRNGGRWYLKHRGRQYRIQATRTDARERVEKMLEDLAQNALVTLGRDDLRRTARVLGSYSRHNESSAPFSLLRASVLVALRDYASAGEAYLNTYAAEPQGSLAREALLGALRSWEELPESAQAMKRMTDTCDLLATAFPDAPEVPGCLLRGTRWAVDQGAAEQMAERITRMARMLPATPQARDGARLVTGALFEGKQYRLLDEVGQVFSESDAFRNRWPDTYATLQRLWIESAYRAADKNEESEQRASGFLSFASRFPNDALTPVAQYNASIGLAEQHKFSEAMQVIDIVVAASSKAEEAIRVRARRHQCGLFSRLARPREALACWRSVLNKKDHGIEAARRFADLVVAFAAPEVDGSDLDQIARSELPAPEILAVAERLPREASKELVRRAGAVRTNDLCLSAVRAILEETPPSVERVAGVGMCEQMLSVVEDTYRLTSKRDALQKASGLRGVSGWVAHIEQGKKLWQRASALEVPLVNAFVAALLAEAYDAVFRTLSDATCPDSLDPVECGMYRAALSEKRTAFALQADTWWMRVRGFAWPRTKMASRAHAMLSQRGRLPEGFQVSSEVEAPWVWSLSLWGAYQ